MPLNAPVDVETSHAFEKLRVPAGRIRFLPENPGALLRYTKRKSQHNASVPFWGSVASVAFIAMSAISAVPSTTDEFTELPVRLPSSSTTLAASANLRDHTT